MSDEEDILDRVDGRRDELIGLAQSLISIRSENPTGNEAEIAEFLKARLAPLAGDGMEVHTKESGRPNLLARVRGQSSGPSFMLVAHTDTKPVGDLSQWTVDPYGAEIVGGKLYGRGAADMKAALAAKIVAAEVLKEVGFPGEIQLLFVADEEAGSAFGAKYLVDEVGLRADGALIGEPCGIDASYDSLHIAHRGIFCFKIKVLGTQMHSSMSDIRPSVNASVKLAEVLQKFASDFRPTDPSNKLYPQGPTVNLAVMLEGGVFYGVYPGHAEFASEIRIVPGMDREQTVREVQDFVAQLKQEDPSLRIELDLKPRPNLTWIDGMQLSEDEPVVQAVASAAETVRGRRPPLRGFPGGTDARALYVGAGIPTIPAFGPGLLDLCHGPDEYVPVEDVVHAAKIYALAAYRFLTGKAPPDSRCREG